MEQNTKVVGSGAVRPQRVQGSALAFCYNCETTLQGQWCHACGQHSQNFHRAAHHLIFELLEDFFHADGRIAYTLPRLFTRPAALTTDYLAGKRAPQIPPLRLFLGMLVVLFFVGAASIKIPDFTAKTPDQQELLKQAQAELSAAHIALPTGGAEQFLAWGKTHVSAAMARPDALLAALSRQAERYAFLTLPISAFLLSGLFVFRRRFVLFDHLVFSMHSLSFQGLVVAVVMLGGWVGQPLTALILLAMPLHLFFHLRGVYGLSSWGTVARMALLGLGTGLAFSILGTVWIVAGLDSLSG